MSKKLPYVAEMLGVKYSGAAGQRVPRRQFATIAEARAWAETWPLPAARCAIFKGKNLVAIHVRLGNSWKRQRVF
jgi:hypothetical protein